MIRTARIHYACVFLAAWTAMACGQHGSIDMTAPSSRAASEWLRPCLDLHCSDKVRYLSQWKLVPKSGQASATAMLVKTPWVRLNNTQARELANVTPPSQGKTAPYLLRAVGVPDQTSGFAIGILQNGDIWVMGGALSRHPLPVERRPIIVWLDHAPHEVYVSFGAAE